MGELFGNTRILMVLEAIAIRSKGNKQNKKKCFRESHKTIAEWLKMLNVDS